MSISVPANPEDAGRDRPSTEKSARRELDPSNTDRLLEHPVQDETLRRQWDDPPPTLIGRLKALQNDAIGQRLIFTAFGFFVLGGINALLMRVQLARADNTFLSPDTYNQFFTMHGSTMMYLFAVPILEGFTILLLPFLLGNREMPFPRLGVFSFWVFLFGGLLFYASFLFGAVPENGWFAYVPLAGPQYSPGISMDFWLLALGVAEVSAIAAGIEIIISILNMRAPGMSLGRMPLFAWAMLVTAFAILFAFTTLFVASMLMEADRHFGTQFYNTAAGGTPILWQHLFWIFGHPEVYIQFLPATGIVSMIVPVFARRPIVGYPLIVIAIISTGFLSFGLWVHHMFAVGLPDVAMAFFTAASTMIAIPAGIQVFAWITTIMRGRPRWNTPLLFVIGFLVIFVLGGITGVMVASVPFDSQVHDSFFVVAHFHYVLIGGVTFPVFAAFYYWLPKWSGRLLDERLGKLHFWLMFIGFNVMASPGAGKTSLILRTMENLGQRVRIGVIEGDIAGRIDADKVMAAGATDVVQINTGGNCHLEANMIQTALDQFDLNELDIVIVENVGNLVCPTHWSLGEHLRVCLLSTPEGHDKPVKYPEIFASSEVVILNKIDLSEMVDFDRDFFYGSLHALNPDAITFEISCRTSEGVRQWSDWLLRQLAVVREPAHEGNS